MIKRQFLVLWVLLLVASCATLPGVVEQSGQDISVLEQDIRNQVERRKKSIKAFEAQADLELKYPGVDYKGQVLVIGQRPCSVRMDCFGPFHQPVLSFTTDGRHFTFLSVLAMRYYNGNLASPAIASLIPKGVKMQDIYCWFLGSYNFKDRRLISYSRHSCNSSCLILELSNKRSGLREEIWFEPSEDIIRRVVLKDRWGSVVLIAESEGLIKNKDFSCPKAVHFSLPSSGVNLSLVYKKVNSLSGVPPVAFSLNCPPGFKYRTFN